MSSCDVCIGIDGGGSTTKLSVIKVSDKTFIFETTGAASNWNSVGEDLARQAINDVITAAIAGIGEKYTVVAVAAGISGVHSKEDAEMVKCWISTHFPKATIEVFNDVVAAITSGTDGELSGFALIAGTGSNCMAVDGRHQESAGGWGPLLGNYGSGHAIGTEALVAGCRAIDGRGPDTQLIAMIETALNWTPGTFQKEIIPWMYKDGNREWREIAALAPLVFEARENGDSVARMIIDKQVQSMATTVQTVARKMGWLGGPPRSLVLVGSLWKQEIMRNLFEAQLEILEVPHISIIPKLSPAQGVTLFARRTYLDAKHL
uniref:N-acetyl-D-glucosamine kinase n=1 Tax=Spongospora subterranea TaxID=70186 RepID=A0A0H5RLH2_9EUKA|eukprot:CRZ09579.1 hypothetical protein [Spongospora subterranea]